MYDKLLSDARASICMLLGIREWENVIARFALDPEHHGIVDRFGDKYVKSETKGKVFDFEVFRRGSFQTATGREEEILDALEGKVIAQVQRNGKIFKPPGIDSPAGEWQKEGVHRWCLDADTLLQTLMVLMHIGGGDRD